MDFNERLSAHSRRANTALQHFIAQQSFQSSHLIKAMEYGALLGGKRLRPLLVYATGAMLCADDAALDAPAAAVECIHAYSLIHDDLPAMDNSSLRRGKPTCHIKFGEETAILAGDALQTLAFSILADTPMPGVTDRARIAMLSELAKASGVAGMCGGQALDLASESQQIDLAELEKIYRHKTGALIRSAVRLGALAGGKKLHSALSSYLDRYAEAIGLAFQVQDDILDIIGHTAIIGKQQGADQRLEKITYPALVGLHSAKVKTWDLYQESLCALEMLAAQSYDITLLQALAEFIIGRNK